MLQDLGIEPVTTPTATSLSRSASLATLFVRCQDGDW
jgi:hypothetical protein